MIDNNDIDSLLFDMDGTLWDATGSYAAVWNRCFADCCIDIRLTGADLVPYMGKPIEVIVEGITSGRVPAAFSRDAFVAAWRGRGRNDAAIGRHTLSGCLSRA